MSDYDTIEGVERVCARIRRGFERFGRVNVVVRAGKRSLDQNAVQHVWYGQVARATGLPAVEIQRDCKLLFGVPILLAEDEDFRRFFELALAPLPFEDRLKAMDYVPVTRLMTPAQMTTYLRNVRRHFAFEGIVNLRFLDELFEDERDARLADERQAATS